MGIKYAKVLKSAIFRMIADKKTKNVITLHTNGMISVADGMNLTLLYSFKNDGRFFMDLALSPSRSHLLISEMYSLAAKPIQLEPCYMGKIKKGGCCSFKCFSVFFAIVVAIAAVTIGL